MEIVNDLKIIPTSYEADECEECTNWDCKYMPDDAYDKLMEDELDSIFPNRIDDGFNFSDYGED